MKKITGFTLIELLIVIGIIGVLASIVMGAVGQSREKGKDGAVKADMSGIRAQAAIFMDDNNSSYGTAGELCDTAGSVFDPASPNSINPIVVASESVAGASAVCANSSTAYVVAVPLQGGGSWCVDSNGYASTTALDTAGLLAGIACQ